MSRQTYYSQLWEDEEKFPELSKWVSGKEGEKTFSCKLCNSKPLQLGNMGVKALKTHQKTSGHIKKVEAGKNQMSLAKSFASTSKKVTVQQTFSVATSQMKKTEILMALQAVLCHVSSRTMEMFVQMSIVYFPVSDIPDKLQLGRIKIGYLVQFGLAPYYRAQIFRLLLPKAGFPPKFVSCFDEAFNRISKRKQMDVHVIFFDSNKQEVVRSFVGSHFIGHASAEDTFASLKEVHEDLELVHNFVQVSMDGPNVNWKTEDHRKIQDPNCPNLIVIGSCRLHVVHSVYGAGQNTTDWSLDKFLIFICSIFKMAPARCEDYLVANNLHESHKSKNVSYLFSQKFCGHRWLENGAALKRAIEINHNLKVFFKDLKEKKNIPTNDDRFTTAIDKLASPMHLAALHFSHCISNEIELYLVLFQAERPLAVFLCEKFKELLVSLMERFAKLEVLAKKDSVGKMLRLDLTDVNNLRAVENVKVGSAATLVYKKAKTTHAIEVRKFTTNARNFLVRLVKKLKERSPLRYKFTLYISSLSPTQIAAGNHDFLTDLFSKLCLHLVECNWISSLCADRAETSYKSFIKSNDVKERMKAFTLDLRIDTLYMELLNTHIELREVVKIGLILSHGNARVEAGVSINEDMLSENMYEEALVAHRIVYDGVVNSDGLENVEVDKEMMKYVDKAHSQYLHHLKTSKENQTIAEKKEGREKKVEL